MTIRICSTLRATLAMLAASLGTMHASAQAPATVPAQPGPSARAEVAPPGYRSALEGYQPYSDEKTVNWKDANDVTARVGGWRVYAKEASQDSPPDAAAKPANSAVPAKP